MTAADRPTRATPRGRGTGTAKGRGAARTANPVVPARREQRIERSPATVVRQAGEVRGRARPSASEGFDESWSVPFDRVLPVGPASPDLDLVIDTGTVELDHLPALIGDITYDRAPAWPGPPNDDTVMQPAIEVPAAPVVDEPAPEAQPQPHLPVRPRRSLFKRRTRVRRVSRVVRRVDAWSVLKISVIFYALAYVVLLIAGVLLWNLAQTTGTVANIEGFVRELFGLRTFRIDGQRLYRASWPIGVFLAVAGTGMNVTVAVMFNLITDLVGGVRVTVLEEEVRVVETGSRHRRGRRARPQAG